MPELPEVETVRRGLAPVLEGARLARVEARRPDLRFPFPEGFVQRLTGARIERLHRRAKYLLAALDRDETLVMHLGMSGRFEITGATTRLRPGDFRAGPAARPAACPRRVRDRRRRDRDVLRPAPVRLHGPDRHRRPGRSLLVQRPRPRAARQRVRRGPPRADLRRTPAVGESDPARPAHRRRARQHLCLRGAVPGRHRAPDAGRRDPAAAISARWSR